MRDDVFNVFKLSTAVCAAAMALAVSPVMAQQQPPTFRSGSGTIVSLFATVTDTQQRLVPALEQAAFEVLDNDKPQPIVVFSNDPQPITVVVMLDTSGSMTASISLLKAAAEQFLLRLLPDDRAAVGAFNDKIELGARFSNNRDALIADVKDLDFGNGTRLYDAVAASLDLLRSVEGRKVVLIFTDGDDTASRIGRGTVLDRARAEEVMVYGVGLQSEYFDGVRLVRSRPDSGLKKLADETGGGYFELKKTSELGTTFTRVANELHSQYALGFEAKQLDGKVHRLSVRLKEPGMTARARKSYVATAPTSPGGK
jgi:Ca-activated chloride channel family protein